MKTRIFAAMGGMILSISFISFLMGWLIPLMKPAAHEGLSWEATFCLLHLMMGYCIWCSSESFLLLRPYPLIALFLVPEMIIPNAYPYFWGYTLAVNAVISALSLAELYYAWKWSRLGKLERA